MPSQANDSLIVRAQTSFEKLAAAAKTLNKVSDRLGQTVVELDAALKTLNLGISTWTSFSSWEDGPDWDSHDIGYAKITGKWGLAIRSRSGSYPTPEYDKTDEWLFNDAPRMLRLQAVDKIPDLLEELAKSVAQFTVKIAEKLKQSEELSIAITAMAKGTHQGAKETRAVEAPPPTVVEAPPPTAVPAPPPVYELRVPRELRIGPAPSFTEILVSAAEAGIRKTAENPLRNQSKRAAFLGAPRKK
jgi:hypothetical protein